MKRGKKRYYVLGLSNAGKSSLIAKILEVLSIKSNKPIVHHTIHTTRDYVTYSAGEDHLFVDTPGLCKENIGQIVETLKREMSPDMVLIYVSDITRAQDPIEKIFIHRLARALEKKSTDFLYLLNKRDIIGDDSVIEDRFTLGIGGGRTISTTYRDDIDQLLKMLNIVGSKTKRAVEHSISTEKIGIFGRPNVGKSTLFNLLMNGQYATVSHEPHTTRDPIIRHNRGKVYSDTAGITKRKQSDIIKYVSYKLSDSELASATVAIIIVDISDLDFSYIERELVNRAVNRRISTLVVFNKVDLLEDKLVNDYRDAIVKKSLIPSWIPSFYISLEDKNSAQTILDEVENMIVQHNSTYSLKYLNDEVKEKLNTKMKLQRGGIKFLRQDSTKPISISVFLKSRLNFSRRRYLENLLRLELKLTVPIRIIFKDTVAKKNRKRQIA